jgi:hypothetical protein
MLLGQRKESFENESGRVQQSKAYVAFLFYDYCKILNFVRFKCDKSFFQFSSAMSFRFIVKKLIYFIVSFFAFTINKRETTLFKTNPKFVT